MGAKKKGKKDPVLLGVQFVPPTEKKKELLLKENEKLKVERTKTRTGSGLFAKRPEANTQQFKQAVGNLFAGAGISFEEFAKEKNQEEYDKLHPNIKR